LYSFQCSFSAVSSSSKVALSASCSGKSNFSTNTKVVDSSNKSSVNKYRGKKQSCFSWSNNPVSSYQPFDNNFKEKSLYEKCQCTATTQNTREQQSTFIAKKASGSNSSNIKYSSTIKGQSGRKHYLARRKHFRNLYSNYYKLLFTKHSSRWQAGTLCTFLHDSHNGQVCQENSDARIQTTVDTGSSSIVNSNKKHCYSSRLTHTALRNSRNATKASNRGSSRKKSRVLFNIFSSTKERRGSSASNQSEGPEQIYLYPEVQNAYPSDYIEYDSQEQLAGVSRSQRCIFPCANASRALQVSQVCVPRADISVQSPTIRAIDSSQGIHQGIGSSDGVLTSKRNTYLSLLGRLSDSGQVKAINEVSSGNNLTGSETSWVCHQSQEVSFVDDTAIEIPGNEHRHVHNDSVSASGQSQGSQQLCVDFSTRRSVQNSQVLPSAVRFDGLLHKDGPTGQVIYATNAALSQFAMEVQEKQFALQNNDTMAVSSDPGMVVITGQSVERGQLDPQQALSDCHNRCFQDGMGGSLQWEACPGSMETTPTKISHQSPGTFSSVECFKGFSPLRDRSYGLDSDGQYGRTPLHQQVRRHQVSPAVSDNMGHAYLVSESQGSVKSCTSSRQGQCTSRQVISSNDIDDRMGTQSEGSGQAISDLVNANNRSLCLVPQQEATGVLFTEVPSPGQKHGWTQSQLDREVCIRFSPTSDFNSCSPQGNSRQSNSDFDCTEMDQERMVSNISGSFDRHSSETSIGQRFDHTGSGQTPASQSSRVCVSSMESQRADLLARGLSQEATETCLAATSDSTRQTYSAGWRDFDRWCGGQDIDPYTSTVHVIVNFLQACLQKGLAYNTVKSRASAIASEHTFYRKKKGTFESLLRHQTVMEFFRGALIKNPPVKQLIPTWDLTTVLQALSRHPFEPIHSIDLKFLTWKTAFLVAICSANRVHELQALDYRPAYCTISARGVVLRTHPSYRPKVVKPENMQRVLEFSRLGQDDFDNTFRSVCVCRALEAYVKATETLRSNTSQLFVTFQSGRQGKPAAKRSIAHWIKSCIQQAYIEQSLPLPQVNAHSTRKQSVSWADMNNISVHDICQQASWTSANTFIKHYKLHLPSSVSSRHADTVIKSAFLW